MDMTIIPTAYERDIFDLSRGLIELASDAGVTIGTAESCTGGLISGALTAIPGSSTPVMGGITSYACSVKHDVLGVSQETLDTVGAVSSECAQQMADGARRVLCCDVAVAVTGIAGPGGAVPGKPVGTVWFALATPSVTRTVRHLFEGERDEVRAQTTLVALNLLVEGVREVAST